MIRRIALATLVLAAGVGLTACSGSGGGNVFTSTNSTTSNDTGGPTSGGGGSGAAQQLAAMQPCSLLSSTVISQNSLNSLGSQSIADGRQCKWQQPTGTDSNGNTTGFTIGVTIRDSQGLSDIDTDGYTEASNPINGRQADLLTSTGGLGCFVAISVTSGSRVDVGASASSGDTNYSCLLAVQFAKDVEPELPGGSS